MFVTIAALLRDVILERRDQRQRLLRARHGHIQQAAFFLDHFRLAGSKLGREVAIRYVQHIHGIPFLAFRRVHGGQDQVVFIEQRIASQIAGCTWRVECQLGKEALASRVAAGNLFQLFKVGLTRVEAIVNPLQVWLVPPYALVRFAFARTHCRPLLQTNP